MYDVSTMPSTVLIDRNGVVRHVHRGYRDGFEVMYEKQIRDLQFLVTDGQTFFHDERRNTRSRVDCVDEASLGFTIVNEAENRRYRFRKSVISHPHQDCVLMRTHVDASAEDARALQLFVLCAPHLEVRTFDYATQ